MNRIDKDGGHSVSFKELSKWWLDPTCVGSQQWYLRSRYEDKLAVRPTRLRTCSTTAHPFTHLPAHPLTRSPTHPPNDLPAAHPSRQIWVCSILSGFPASQSMNRKTQRRWKATHKVQRKVGNLQRGVRNFSMLPRRLDAPANSEERDLESGNSQLEGRGNQVMCCLS